MSGFPPVEIGGIMGDARSPAENHIRRGARHGRARRAGYCVDYQCSHSIAVMADQASQGLSTRYVHHQRNADHGEHRGNLIADQLEGKIAHRVAIELRKVSE
jgi:hypothetical protein